MQHERLGCLSPLALLTTGITVVILIVAYITGGSAMFSPGALNAQAGAEIGGVASHAETGANCASCHPAPWSSETLAGRCMACHTPIQQDNADATSLHGGFLAQDIHSTCRDCHTDHRGPAGELTIIDPLTFPHTATSFDLAAHAQTEQGLPFACIDCHPDSLTGFELQLCADCHQELDPAYMDGHLLDFGTECLACHDGVDRYTHFDHSQTDFMIDGAHSDPACRDCHSNARTLADLQNTPGECQACHLEQDAHAGKFGAQCGACHSTLAWKPAEFDHDLAAFKLEGKHAEVECAECHSAGYAGTPIECAACHLEDDAHAGQYGVDCGACHTPADWGEATFDHSLSAFPLDGAHVQVECQDCHVNGQYQGTPVECAACHSEPAFHAGMFGGQACSECHSTIAWQPARYDGLHTFPMNHGEGGNTCADCHQPDLTQWTCYTCHDRAGIEGEHREEGIADFSDCLGCHPTGEEGDDD